MFCFSFPLTRVAIIGVKAFSVIANILQERRLHK